MSATSASVTAKHPVGGPEGGQAALSDRAIQVPEDTAGFQFKIIIVRGD